MALHWTSSSISSSRSHVFRLTTWVVPRKFYTASNSTLSYIEEKRAYYLHSEFFGHSSAYLLWIRYGILRRECDYYWSVCRFNCYMVIPQSRSFYISAEHQLLAYSSFPFKLCTFLPSSSPFSSSLFFPRFLCYDICAAHISFCSIHSCVIFGWKMQAMRFGCSAEYTHTRSQYLWEATMLLYSTNQSGTHGNRNKNGKQEK